MVDFLVFQFKRSDFAASAVGLSFKVEQLMPGDLRCSQMSRVVELRNHLVARTWLLLLNRRPFWHLDFLLTAEWVDSLE